MNKLFLSLCLLLISFAASAQERLSKVILKDIEGRTVQTDTISNNGKPLIIAFLLLGASLVIVNSQVLMRSMTIGSRKRVFDSLLCLLIRRRMSIR